MNFNCVQELINLFFTIFSRKIDLRFKWDLGMK